MSETGLFALEDILGEPLIESSDRDVKIFGIKRDRIGRRVEVSGYVLSESRPGYFHPVNLTYLPEARHVLYGECTCESYRYHGDPCRHILTLRNVFTKNQTAPKKER